MTSDRASGCYIRVHRLAGGRFPRRSRHRAAPVETTQVPREVLAVALELADGDRRRLRSDGPDAVLVVNSWNYETPDERERRIARERIWNESV
jgi:hypothetical protein